MAGKEEQAADGGGAGGAKQANPMMLVIVGAVALFVAVLGAQVAAPIITNMISGGSHAAGNTAAGGEEPGEGEEGAEHGNELAKPAGPAIYVPLDPPFVVSFSDEGGDTRFLQLTLQAMARSERAVEQIKTHGPAIRNAFLFLISAYKVEDLATLEGKEKLRAAMLESANEIMTKNTGEPAVEELFFTSLVIQ